MAFRLRLKPVSRFIFGNPFRHYHHKGVVPKNGVIPKDIDEAKAMKDIERLEKRDWQLWLLTIFVILILTLFIVVSYFNELSGSPRDFFKGFNFLNTYIISSAFLTILFCIYVLVKNLEIRHLRKEIIFHRTKLENVVGTLEEVTAFFQVSSVISAHKDLATVLELIAREALSCLKAHRSTVFLLEEKSEVLKAQFTYTPDPLDAQIGLFEEKEVARKAMKQKRPFLLKEKKDFSEFFKYGERERKITSLMSIPLSSQSKPIGVLSVVLIDERRSFNDKDLQYLSIFGNHASIAMENASLLEKVRNSIDFRKSFDQYLDDILKQLQALSGEERRRIEEHIGRLIPVEKREEKPAFPEPQTGGKDGKADQPVTLIGELGPNRRKEDRVEEVLQVEFEDESVSEITDLSSGGMFIRTSSPLELGEQFLLNLYIADGRDPVKLTCKVVWTNQFGKENKNLPRGMGVKFLDLPLEAKVRIEDYLQSHRQSKVLPKNGKAYSDN